MPRLLVILILSFFITTLTTLVNANTPERSALTADQKLFLQAHDAIKVNDRVAIAKYKKKLKNYPLLPYITYLDLLHRHLKNSSTTAIVSFIENNPDTHLANRLTNKWLNTLGETKQWELFLQYYDPKKQTSANLACYHLQAKLAMSNDSKKSDYSPLIRKHWVTGRPLSKACQPIDTYIRKNQQLTGSMLWDNIILAFEKRQITFATKLSKDLSRKEQQFYHAWLKIAKNPKLLAQGLPKEMPIRIKRAVFKQTITRLARTDILLANELLKKYATKYRISKPNINQLKRTIALHLAYRYKPEAKAFLYEINKTAPSDATLRWQLQVALKNSNWASVLATYELLEPEKQLKNKWQYWKARALNETHQKAQAKIIFTKLATKRDFYGFLSADILNLDYQFNFSKNANIKTDFIIKKYSQIPRITELVAIGWEINANREWHHLINTAAPKNLNAINQIALNLANHHAAIRGAAKARDWNNVNLRFPTPHKNYVIKYANKNDIDPAWVYGVMRRESAFATDILSSAGARGLMQLMPKTAQYIGGKIGVNSSTYGNLGDPKSNIKLGSAYLSYLYKKYDGNIIKTTAAYNAGPRRINAWIPQDNIIPADQWIETILFTETRRYVKAVMEYKIIFQYLLNQKNSRLEKYMLPIGPFK